LTELDILPEMRSTIPRPFLLWGITGRIKSMAKNPTTDRYRNSISLFVDQLMEQNENALIVSHGLAMLFLEKELRSRGFTGKKVKPKYGEVFVFNKHDSRINE
jgi:hypothetical protein